MSQHIKASFAQGWHDAVMGMAAETEAEVSERYPDADATAYLCGADDGKSGDRWRLDYEDMWDALKGRSRQAKGESA